MNASLDITAFRKSIKARLAPTQSRMQVIADAALQQTRDRFTTGGASGGQAWPPSDFGSMGKKPPLSGLEDSFKATAEEGEAKVATDDFINLVHNCGTVGAGGTLKTIVPVHAKALYVPLTPLGKSSYEAHKNAAPVIRTVFAGMPRIEKPDFSTMKFHSADGAKYGRDFVFLKSVDLPPRGQLPTSDQERLALAKIAANALKS